MDTSHLFSRRQIVGGLTASLASVTVFPAFATPPSSLWVLGALPPELEDPRTKYPVPPFPGQS